MTQQTVDVDPREFAEQIKAAIPDAREVCPVIAGGRFAWFAVALHTGQQYKVTIEEM